MSEPYAALCEEYITFVNIQGEEVAVQTEITFANLNGQCCV
jgi:hypothetical protein